MNLFVGLKFVYKLTYLTIVILVQTYCKFERFKQFV